MKKITLVGLIFCMLVVPSYVSVAQISDTNRSTIIQDDDVPVWNKDNSWTFSISEFTVDYTYESTKILMNGKIDDFKWTVSDTSGSTYKVDVTGKVTASFEAALPFLGTVINVEGDIKPNLNKITGTIVFTKSNLEIEDFDAVIKGIANIAIKPIPIKLPIPIRISVNSVLSTLFPLLQFPLQTLKFWNMPEMDIKMDMKLGGILGILKIPITFSTHYSFTPLAFSCLNMVSVTVSAGTYDAWKIKSIIGDFFEYYYAPDVGNLVKIDVNMPRGEIHGELIDTNYA